LLWLGESLSPSCCIARFRTTFYLARLCCCSKCRDCCHLFLV
jgi:hypothetical protein